MRFFCILLTSLFFFFAGLNAQTRIVRGPQKSLVGIEVHFRLDKHNLDLNYMGNDEALRLFANTIDSIGLSRIDSVVIVSQSSPEGVYEHNIKLSERRARTMRRYIEGNHPLLKDKLFVHPDGESWQQLRDYVESDTKLKDATKAKILSIIDADINIGTKKWRMQQLPVYRYLLATYYKRIRNSMFCILYFTEDRLMDILPEPEPKVWPKAEFIPITSYKQEQRDICFAIKTNLLYDLGTALNVELEIPIGKRFSIAVEDVFPWWHSGNKYAFQMWEMGVEGRYWFKRTPARKVLSGHFAGIYAMSAKYDFQWDRDINYQGEYWSAGLTYGYAMPLGKYFNFELSASIGYLSTAYCNYQPSPDYGELIRNPYEQGRLGYFGPTKLKASLVLPVTIPVKSKRVEVRYE